MLVVKPRDSPKGLPGTVLLLRRSLSGHCKLCVTSNDHNFLYIYLSCVFHTVYACKSRTYVFCGPQYLSYKYLLIYDAEC